MAGLFHFYGARCNRGQGAYAVQVNFTPLISWSSIIKFADDSVVLGLNNDETTY